MADFLDYVEQNYGCVAEYNRCREEDEAYEYEKEQKRVWIGVIAFLM